MESLKTYLSSNNTKVSYRVWMPKVQPIAVVQIVHGMAEHSKRYQNFAQFLNQHGYIVIADDHVGHGLTSQSNGQYGFLYKSNGWQKMVQDVYELNQIIHTEYNLPVIMLGHSMGSFIARSLMILHPDIAIKWIISGTGFFSKAELIGGSLLAKITLLWKSPKAKASFIDKISFGANNKKFKSEGEFAWLSSNRAEVDKYIQDPYCGGVFSVAFFRDLFAGAKFIQESNNLARIPYNSNVLLISGGQDPVGNFGKGVIELYSRLQSQSDSVQLRLLPKMRHEILNETNKAEVYQYILDYINS